MKRLFAALLLVGCSGSPEPKEEPAKEQVVAQPLTDSACMGNRVPPTNYLQETAFASVSEPNAAEIAKGRAQSALRDRICQGYRCGEIESKLTLWNTEQDAQRVCAMVVVEARDVDAFLAAPRATFDKDLDASAADIAATLTTMKKKRLAFDNVRDLGVDGGPRAEWLIDRMVAALSSTNVTMTRLPKDWNGLQLPSGVDGVLSGRITQVHGRESLLEVTWNLNLGDSFKSASPITFPEMIGPVINANTIFPDLPDLNQRVALRFDARPGGALCAGQTTRMRLSVSEPLHVRIVNLYGKDNALLIWASDGPLQPGKEVDLGEFVAVPGPTSAAERFLVVAAQNPEDLGELVAASVVCKVPTKEAEALGRGDGLKDGAKRYSTSRSFRVMSGAECSTYTAPPTSAADEFPNCW